MHCSTDTLFTLSHMVYYFISMSVIFATLFYFMYGHTAIPINFDNHVSLSHNTFGSGKYRYIMIFLQLEIGSIRYLSTIMTMGDQIQAMNNNYLDLNTLLQDFIEGDNEDDLLTNILMES